jgi:3-hydroxyacyl-CoA dehydrogenase
MHRIQQVAVLGSGLMGTGIACHLANAGLKVLMMDLKSDSGDPNAIAKSALEQVVKTKPAPLYIDKLADNIEVGNFDDDFYKIKNCDWILEAVIEKIDVKSEIFEMVDQFRRPGSIVSSNTSGIPISHLIKERSDDFKINFIGTHFFNPARYLELLEIIPTDFTQSDVVEFIMDFGSKILGKKTVLCKDTPAFVANRIGVYTIAHIISLAEQLALSPTEVDKLTGSVIGRPNTGTFRLGDFVGLDTAQKVIDGIKINCPGDDQVASLVLPKAFDFLIKNKFYGNKTGKGFYEKTSKKDDKGRSVILELDLKNNTYHPTQKPKLESLLLAKQIGNVQNRIKALYNFNDAGGELIKSSLSALFAYSSNRLPEIAENLHSIDDAMKAGFGWEFGPFEYWDLIGIHEGIAAAENCGFPVADWVKDMVNAGHDSFYIFKDGQKKYYDFSTKSYLDVTGLEGFIILDQFREKKPVLKNDELVVHDIGDQVLCAEFRGKANVFGEGVIRGIDQAITIAEEGDWRGLVIGNNAKNFTVGANLMLIGMMAFQKQFDQLDEGVRLFQNMTMRCRHSLIPVVAATQGYVFGGGCETIMHCDAAVSAAESYIGLVEVGVGLLPGAGGTKEFTLRASDSFVEGGVHVPQLIERLKTIAMAQVSTSAEMAYGYGYLTSKDEVSINGRLNLKKAKDRVVQFSNDGYVPAIPREDITVLGRTGLGALYAAINELKLGGYATDYDLFIAKKIAYILCGGDLTGSQKVSEQYLLDIEREGFIALCGEEKTLARIQYMLEKNKPLRN